MNVFYKDEDTTTDFVRTKIKRNFQSFDGVKQDLSEKFDQTPTKVMKFAGCTPIMPTQRSSPRFEHKEMEKVRQELTLKDADIKSLEATIIKLENAVAKLEMEAKEAQINHDKEIAEMRAICDVKVVKSSEMKSKLQYLMKKEKSAVNDYEELKKEFEKQKFEMDKKMLQVCREKYEQGDKAQQLRLKWLDTEEILRNELMTLKTDHAVLKTKYEEAETQLELRKRLQHESGDQHTRVKELMVELTEEKDKVKVLNRKMSDHEDNMVITKALKGDLDLVPSMKKELEKLRLENEQLRHNEQNTLLLEEELRSVRRSLEESLARCEKFTELEVSNEDLQARLQRWEASDNSGSRRPQSPSSLSRRVNELETSRAMMLLKQGDMESKMKREKLKMERILAEKAQLSLDLSTERATVTQQMDSIKRLKRKASLLSKERDGLKSILNSYESEATINIDVQNQHRIHQLEQLVEEYQGQNEESESRISDLEEKLTKAEVSYNKIQQQCHMLQKCGGGQSNKQDQEKLKQLTEQLAVMENTLLKVQEERDNFEARIEQRQLQGDYDPSKTKIVHIIKNPFSELQEERKELVKKLTAENDSLRKRNEILENSGGQVEDLTMQVNEKLLEPSPTKELEVMKKELKRQETRNKRLMEVYSKTSREFREICYQLTGYKIDIPCCNQYRLTNMYSLSPNEYLWFQQNEQGEIQMLETEFSNSLKDLMELYLQKQHSIPLFLSQITMDLYGKQTMILE